MSLEILRGKRMSKDGESSSTGVQHNYTYYDMLTLRPPESSLVASVPRPRRAKLKGGLPLWNTKPLNAKLPLMNGPDGPLVFTRAKLGEKLWKGTPASGFQLTDEAGVRFEYEAVHDEHLRRFLLRPDTVALLRARGIVTPAQGKHVACTVDQYNTFRQFLYGLYRDELRREADRRNDEVMEKLQINKAFENAKKEVKNMKKYEDTSTKRLSNLKRLEALQMERLEKCKIRLQRIIDRALKAEKKKEEDQILRKRRMEAYDEKIKSRIAAANIIERKNKIKAMGTRYKQDMQKKREFEKKRQLREMENKQKAEARWKRKVEEQKKQIAKEKYLREQREKDKELFRQRYMRTMEKHWSKLEDELNMKKCRGTLDKLKYGRRKKSMREIMISVAEAYTSRKSMGMLSQDEDTIETVMDHVYQVLKEIRYGNPTFEKTTYL